MRIGSLLCEMNSTPPRYAGMFAEAYGLPFIPQEQGEELDCDVELVLNFSEAATERDRSLHDLTVTPTANGYQIETDPMSCLLEFQQDARGQSKAHVDITVHQASRDSAELCCYWPFINNRILLLLDALRIHSAAIEVNGKVNIFCGHKGAGKSTLSVFLAQAGGTILAEDHVLLRRRQEGIQASGCSTRMRVTAATEAVLLPNQLENETVIAGELPKKQFLAERFFSAMPYVDRKPCRLFLNHVGQSFSVRPLKGKEAMLQMVDRTVDMYRFADQKDYSSFLVFLSDFLKQIEVYELELSPDLGELPLVLEMLNDLDGKADSGANN